MTIDTYKDIMRSALFCVVWLCFKNHASLRDTTHCFRGRGLPVLFLDKPIDCSLRAGQDRTSKHKMFATGEVGEGVGNLKAVVNVGGGRRDVVFQLVHVRVLRSEDVNHFVHFTDENNHSRVFV